MPGGPGDKRGSGSRVRLNPVQIEGSVVIVTGASAGIGKATAERLAIAGANVVATARRQERLEQLVASLASRPGRLLAVPGDIREEGFAAELIGQTVAEFDRVDVLINNAGLGHRNPIATMSPADMHTIIDTNLMGLLYLTQAAVTHMNTQGGGQIINVSSIASQRPLPESALYCASKAAVNFVSRSLRMELKGDNIVVTLVYPGRTLTEFGEARLGRKGVNPSGLARVSADRAAEAIVKAIRTGRREVYVNWYDWLFAHLNRLFPQTTDWITARVAGRVPERNPHET